MLFTLEKAKHMTFYYGKVIELVAMKNHNGQSYLQINLSFLKQASVLLWKIDNETTESLRQNVEFDGNVKYRLSLHTALDPIKKQYISFITKTHLNVSERISFACSADFKDHLNSIKNIQSLGDFGKLPFLSIDSSATGSQKSNRKNRANMLKGEKPSFKWLISAVISIIVVILPLLLNQPHLNKAAGSNTAMADTKAETSKTHIAADQTAGTNMKAVKVHSAVQPGIPYIKLNATVNYRLPDGYVALTFDDGPSQYSAKIIHILKKYRAGGTFFFIGINVKNHPDYARYVYANGYSIGNHSMNHPEMSTLTYGNQKEELNHSTKVIEHITHEKITLFRPPYELFNQQTMDILHKGHYKMILWNRDPQDWKTRNAGEIYHYIRNTKASGSIIVLHESQAVIDALPKIITLFQQKHLKIVSLQS